MTGRGRGRETRDTVSLLRDVASQHADVDAFADADGRRLSFGEWDRAADGIAAGLAECGVEPGDVVALLLPSSIEYMVCYQAVMRLGSITSGINPRLGRDEVAHILDRTTPRVIVLADDDTRALPPVSCVVLRWSALLPYWDAAAPSLPSL